MALAGLRARPDKFGGVSVDLGELRGSPRLERAAFGRWLRGKCRARVPSRGAGGGRCVRAAGGPPGGALSRRLPLHRPRGAMAGGSKGSFTEP